MRGVSGGGVAKVKEYLSPGVLERLDAVQPDARDIYFEAVETYLPNMDESAKQRPATSEGNEIPEELAVEIRRLAHNLSNALEIIVQTSFLLGTTEMKEPASDWLKMLEDGVQKALDINLELRKYVKEHTPR